MAVLHYRCISAVVLLLAYLHITASQMLDYEDLPEDKTDIYPSPAAAKFNSSFPELFANRLSDKVCTVTVIRPTQTVTVTKSPVTSYIPIIDGTYYNVPDDSTNRLALLSHFGYFHNCKHPHNATAIVTRLSSSTLFAISTVNAGVVVTSTSTSTTTGNVATVTSTSTSVATVIAVSTSTSVQTSVTTSTLSTGFVTVTNVAIVTSTRTATLIQPALRARTALPRMIDATATTSAITPTMSNDDLYRFYKPVVTH